MIVKNPVLWLAVVHIAASVIFRFALSTGSRPAVVFPSIYLGLQLAQMSLLGIWGGLGTGRVAARLRLIAAGAAWVWFLLFFENLDRLGGEELFLVVAFGMPIAVTILAAMGAAYLLRSRGVQIRRLPSNVAIAKDQELRFSIMHILVFTTVVAVLIMAAKAVHGFYEARRVGNPSGVFWEITLFALMMCAFYPTTTIAILWASLSNARLTMRVLLPVSLVAAGAILPLFVFPFDARGEIIYVASFLLYAIIICGSLLVLRAMRYRLVSAAFVAWRDTPAIVEDRDINETSPIETTDA